MIILWWISQGKFWAKAFRKNAAQSYAWYTSIKEKLNISYPKLGILKPGSAAQKKRIGS